jgi:hypothetical protein
VNPWQKLSTNTNEWDKYISPVLFAYCTSKQSTTKITPFYLTYGREAKLPIDDLLENVEQIEQRIQNLLDILPHERESAIKRIEVQQFKRKQRYDQHVRHEINFSIGDKVLYYDAAKEKQWTGKLNENGKVHITFMICYKMVHTSYEMY